jgi:hypothetical protein
MKLVSGLLVVALVALLVLLFSKQAQTAELQATVASLSHDAESVKNELDTIKRQLRDAKTASAAATAPTASAAREKLPEQRVEEPPVPGVTIAAPAGWHKNGRNPENYVVGVDSNEQFGGMPSAYVKSVSDAKGSFGGMMQTISAENYAGKRVRLSGWMKTQDANDGGGHLWLRIDGQERGQMLGFDNMDNRPVKGTADWQEASIVLDVPQGARALAYGFFVSGAGKMWVSGQTIQPVGADIATTDMPVPKAPINLGFDPNRPK